MRAVSELQTLSGKALLPGFADDDDQEEVIAVTVQEVSGLFKDCERRLKEMGRTKSEGSGDEVCSSCPACTPHDGFRGLHSARFPERVRACVFACFASSRACQHGSLLAGEPRLTPPRALPSAWQQSVRKNIERRVAQQLQDLGGEFRRGHKSYLAKLKGQTIEEYRPDLSLNDSGAGPSASGGGFFDEEEGRCDPSCADPRFSAAQTLQLVMAERMTDEREKAIHQVAESVGELAEIFKEIQVLVIDQGTILDRIDYNIEQAADRVGNAVVELNKANEHQKKSRTMLCIYVLLLLCGFMVIVLILKKTALS